MRLFFYLGSRILVLCPGYVYILLFCYSAFELFGLEWSLGWDLDDASSVCPFTLFCSRCDPVVKLV